MVDSDFILSVLIRTTGSSQKDVAAHKSPLDAQKWLLKMEWFKYIKMGFLAKQPCWGKGGVGKNNLVLLN